MMIKTKIKGQQEIQRIINKIVKEYKPEKVILFGSAAWGKIKPNSDFDLFIIKPSKKERRFRSTEVENILEDRKFPLDILVYTPKEVKNRLLIDDFFIKRILSQGKVLYEKA